MNKLTLSAMTAVLPKRTLKILRNFYGMPSYVQSQYEELFGQYYTAVEREAYRNGKRGELPCDAKKVSVHNSYHRDNGRPIIEALTTLGMSTCRDIAEYLGDDTKAISTILVKLVRDGIVEKVYRIKKTRYEADRWVYDLADFRASNAPKRSASRA